MQILRSADHRRMPWKNGGGETIEVAAFPPGADLDSFEWRISMASVVSDGPFSTFPGVDRTLAVLDGNGIVLEIEDGDIRLTPDRPTAFFPGDAPTFGRLIDGPIADLNVMTRRGFWRHTMQRTIVPDRMTLQHESGLTVLLALTDAGLSDGALHETLHVHDAAVVQTTDTVTLHARDRPAVLYRIALEPVG